MLKLRNLHEGPPGGHRYFVEQTKTWIRDHPSFFDLVEGVKTHLKANNIPIPGDIEGIIQDQECQRLPSDWCRDETGRPVASGSDADCTSLSVVLQGSRTLLAWKLESNVIEPEEEIIRRSNICSRCPKNDLIPDCTACNADTLKSLIDQIVGTVRIPTDAGLRMCRVCCCTLIPKVRLPLRILQKHLSQKQKEQLPKECWLKE